MPNATKTDTMLRLNRHDRRTAESILARRNTSQHQRAVLAGLGMPDLFKVNGQFSHNSVRADCWDVWYARAQLAAVVFRRPSWTPAVHPARRVKKKSVSQSEV